MARGGGPRSPPPNGGGRGGKKEAHKGNYWKVLDPDAAPAADQPSRPPSSTTSNGLSKKHAPKESWDDLVAKTHAIFRRANELDGPSERRSEQLPSSKPCAVAWDASFMATQPATPATLTFQEAPPPAPATFAYTFGGISYTFPPKLHPDLEQPESFPQNPVSASACSSDKDMEGAGNQSESTTVLDDSGVLEEHLDMAGDLQQVPDQAGPPIGTDCSSSPKQVPSSTCGIPSHVLHVPANEQGFDEAMNSPTHQEQLPDLLPHQPLQPTQLQHSAGQVCPPPAEILCGDAPVFMNLDGSLPSETIAVLSPSSRRDPPHIPAASQLFTTGKCTQGACENVSTTQNSGILQNQQAQGHALAPNAPPSGPFAWSKLQYVTLDKMKEDTFLAKDGISMEPEVAAVQENISKLNKALVAKILGRRVSFPFLLSELKRRWYHYGEFQVITTGPNAFICIFQSLEARDAVLMSGPWIIAGNILGMDKWSPHYAPNSLQGLHSPIWIRLPQLPLLYWDTNNITRLANMLGDPLWMDSHTSSWGRSSFARICVRIDLTKKLKPGVWINGLHGRFFQKVEYEGLSTFCFHCGLIGHKEGSCSSSRHHHSQAPTVPPPTTAATTSPARPPSSPPAQANSRAPASTSEPARVQPSPTPDDDHALGSWNLVLRRKKGKSKAVKNQDTPQPTTPAPLQFSASKVQHLEESSYRILNLRKQKPRVSSAHFTRELNQLGPLATSPRQRKKTSTDVTGGDLVPSSAQ